MDLLQNITENKFTLVLLSEDQYQHQLMEMVKRIEKDCGKICYVCLSNPYRYVIERLKTMGLDLNKFFFIDVLSSHYGKPQQAKNCIFISDPSKLLHIHAAIRKAVAEEKCDFLIFDTISSLLMYEQSHNIVRFANDLTMEKKHQEVNKVFIVLKEGNILAEHNENFVKDVGMFADKMIDLGD